MICIEQLPSEVLEHILLYLSPGDIYSWNEACGVELSGSFWKRTCLRDGVIAKEEEKEINNWKEEYFAYLNWKIGNFHRRNFLCAHQPVKIHKSNVFIPCGNKLNVCSVEDGECVEEVLMSKKVDIFGAYVVSVEGEIVRVYKYSCGTYSHFRTIVVHAKEVSISVDRASECSLCRDEITATMNDDHVVLYQHRHKLLTVVNLESNTFTHHDIDCSFLFGLNISCNRLYTLLLSCNKYIVTGYNLTSKHWHGPVVVSQNAAGVLVPKLLCNDALIVALVTFFISSYNTLKVLSGGGETLHLVQIDNNLYWFCLERDRIVYPKSSSVLEVWDSHRPETVKTITVDPGFTSGITVSTCVLVVVYECHLDVYNYYDCLRLYTIVFDEPKLVPLINKWYCVVFCEDGNNVSVYDFKKGRHKREIINYD
uniref:F-box domain-containing protein n=1 Tax=Clastoptera arizonana TaxID=38151 RepID=A0A1B6D2C2_9HEMI